ncbi:acyl-CoA thioesterase [Saccharopolyspora sp. 5N708]|uniref:acyl-CoA thioesterase n=1 Tax=Saccharopolyspora sp. 5N708 TaxID=3457424 RepID=UPI003FD5FD57
MTATLRHQVEHVDTDAAGVMHFSRYASLAETAVLSYLHDNGTGLDLFHHHGTELAVTNLQIRYLAPATFRDTVLITAAVEHAGAAMLRVRADFATDTDTPLAAARLVLCAVDTATWRPVPLPAQASRSLKGLTRT